MEKHHYPPLEQADEPLIKEGIHRAETGHLDPESSSDEASGTNEEKIPLDDSHFKPTRALYILRHNLFQKEINIIDVSDQILGRYAGGELTDDLRNAARALTENNARASKTVYHFERKHWWNTTASMTSSAAPGAEIASWKHCKESFGKVEIKFPAGSKHGSHDIVMETTHWYRRTNVWVQNSVSYSWQCVSKMKANRMTLVKKIGGKEVVVARYAQRWGSWITGGLLLVDGREIDEAVAVLTTCVMLRRMQQRAAERTRYCGGGGGGGGE